MMQSTATRNCSALEYCGLVKLFSFVLFDELILNEVEVSVSCMQSIKIEKLFLKFNNKRLYYVYNVTTAKQ